MGIDKRLSHHIASIFVRDPIPAYSNEFNSRDVNPELIDSEDIV